MHQRLIETEFFEENASCLPRIIQFTTMRGMYGPSDLLNSGNCAFITKSTIVTNVAIIKMYDAILTCGGINFLIK